MDLSIVKRKLETKLKQGEHYVSPEGIVADIRLIFFNCAKYYKVTTSFYSMPAVKLLLFVEELL